MKLKALTFIFLVASINSFAQYRTDSIPSYNAISDTVVYKVFNKDSTVRKEFFFINDTLVSSTRYWYYKGCTACLKYVSHRDQENRIHGSAVSYFKNGKIESIHTYVRGKMTGPFLMYYEDGILRIRAFYINYRADGLLEIFYPNGNKGCACEFSYGKRDGLQQEYYSNGQLYVKTRYQKGKLVEVLELYEKDGTKIDTKRYRKKMKWFKK
jgi:antitoxin component YwqK of YwqJK toxin-antitoxin module